MTIGQRIKLARAKAAISQKELADKLGVSASMIGQYENDIRKPKLDTQQRIADALGVDIYDVLSDEQQEIFMEGQIDGISMTPLVNQRSGFRMRLDHALSKLNDDGQKMAIERVEELAEMPKYTLRFETLSPEEKQLAKTGQWQKLWELQFGKQNNPENK